MSEKTINKIPNVPNLRFRSYTGSWDKIKLNNVCKINPKTPDLKNEFYYIDLESVIKGELIYKNRIFKTEAPSRAQRVLSYNDICFQCVRPYQLNNYHFKIKDDNQWVASTGYAQLRPYRCNPSFIYQLINSKQFNNEVLLRCTGSSYPAINSNDLGEIEISICDTEEQIKISKFLTLIDKRIATQNKIIEEYKTYKNRISHTIYDSLKNNKKVKLNDICSITTGKLDANAMKLNGEYKFFTCAKEDYYIDTYSFEGESLIISGNGEVGLIKYYNGKFDAYQRTYVLQNFAINPLYVKFALEIELPKKIYKEKNVGAMPYIVLSTLSNIMIGVPANETIEKTANLVVLLDKKIAIEEQILNDYISQKKYLLSNMFI